METKHTKGEWLLDTTDKVIENSPFNCHTITSNGKPIAYITFQEDITEDNANLKLITEAGTVANETGKTPRQLADENKELLKALIFAEKYLHNADRELKNGKTLRQMVNEAIKKAT